MTDAPDVEKRYREFLELMPLTVALAGLPQSDHGKSFNDDQLDARAMTIRKAYRQARNIAKTCTEG